mmetsp:Transcript_10022/g.16754  ORF Transcript_10022/g.16754 Transcript_10022/m.16754 type:complete len:484 (-) Transcript_10022:486-1937(-)
MVMNKAHSSSVTPASNAALNAGQIHTLLNLPYDVLISILLQSSIGPRELCRLERCSSALRKLVDNNIWRQAFLQQRRCNALREPDSWKLEFARRDSWSRGWRQLGPGSHLHQTSSQLRLCGQATAPQKLRRFAMKMMSSQSPSPPSRVDTHIVDQNSSQAGIFHSVNAALMCCKAYDVVVLRPGRYYERLRLDKPVELVGSHPVHPSVIIGIDGPTIEVSSRIVGRISNLRIEQHERAGGGAMSGAVLIKAGSTMVVEECDISSETGHCVVIQGLDSCGYVLHNVITNGKGVGVLVCDHGKGVIEDNDICFNGRAGVAILSGADPHVFSNKIHEGMDSGVLVSEKGRGRIEENDIFANRRAGVAILKEGAPIVKRNRIHDGRDSGVLVCENGKGYIVDNDIFANNMAGVAIGRGGASRVTGNTIRDGNGGSLCLSLHSKGLISANVIYQGPHTSLQVPKERMPELAENNIILSSPDAGDDEMD